MSKEWPPYRVGKPEYLHALGVIASVFNQLEFRFRSLFSIYVQSPDGNPYDLFARKNNQERQRLMAEALPNSLHPQQIKDCVAYFLTGYRVCTDNRNVLMHSLTAFVWLDPDTERCPVLNPAQPDGIVFQNWPKNNPFNISVYSPRLEELRAVADGMKDFEDYGDRLYWHVLKSYEPKHFERLRFPAEAKFALPSKPDLPSALTPSGPAAMEQP
jgi:hypothetical protein